MVAEDKNNSQIETPEEIAGDQNHLSEIKEDEIRTNIISEFGFDAEKDKEQIDKLVEKEKGHRTKLSTAIGQKIKYRDSLGIDPTTGKPKEAPKSKSDERPVDDVITERLEKERLEDMPYPDDLKEKISKVAKINGVSVRKAVSDPYIATLITKWQKDKDAEEVALGRKNKTGKGESADEIDALNDIDVSTPEGRKEYDAKKAALIKKGL